MISKQSARSGQPSPSSSLLLANSSSPRTLLSPYRRGRAGWRAWWARRKLGGCDAAAEEGFGVEADEDLPGGDLIWKAWEERLRSLRHGCRRLGGAPVQVEPAADGRGMDVCKWAQITYKYGIG